jgi:hypothetical protein
MPDVSFTLDPRATADVVWLCGYESGNPGLVRELRRRAPKAEILVTGREPPELWRQEVLEAGASLACPWPMSFDRLGHVFHGLRPAR